MAAAAAVAATGGRAAKLRGRATGSAEAGTLQALYPSAPLTLQVTVLFNHP